jgi:predicted dienelactone hydrolase
MVGRPADIKRLINFMVGVSPAASNIDPNRIGFFGFSAGGYTGLVLIGADPDWAAVLCRFSSATRVCTRILRKEFRAQPLAPEPRIKAAVIADPPGPGIWFTPDSFAAIKVPVQLWASETGGRGLPHIAVTPESVAAINRNLVTKHEYHVVPGAGHFAFLLCGPSIKAVPEFCTDAPGFDRVAFHKQFNADVLGYFRTQLGSSWTQRSQ